MDILFLLSTVFMLQSGATPPMSAPLPVIEQRDCTPIETGNLRYSTSNSVRLRNVHSASLVAWTFEWKVSGEPNTSRVSTDNFFSPSLVVKPGDAVASNWAGPCGAVVEVVAADYADGSTAGRSEPISRLFDIRQRHIREVQLIASVLRTTHLADDGISSRSDLQAVLQRIDDPSVRGGQGALLAILAEAPRTKALFGPPEKASRLSKATIIETIDAKIAEMSQALANARR